MEKLLYILLFFPLGLSAQVTHILNQGAEFEAPHGAFSFADSSVTLDMSTGVWTNITNPTATLFTEFEAENMTFAGDSLTIGVSGHYFMIASLSFSGTASDSWELAFFENNVIADQKMERTTSQTDVGNMTLPAFFHDIEVGDDITLKFRNTASNDDATVISCSWITFLLHR